MLMCSAFPGICSVLGWWSGLFILGCGRNSKGGGTYDALIKFGSWNAETGNCLIVSNPGLLSEGAAEFPGGRCRNLAFLPWEHPVTKPLPRFWFCEPVLCKTFADPKMPRAIPTRLDFHQFPLRREFWENSEANLSPPALVFHSGRVEILGSSSASRSQH